MVEEDIIERIYTVPIRKMVKNYPRTKRAPMAVKHLEIFVRRHMKARDKEYKIWIDTPVNEILWSRGIQKPPKDIRVRVVKFEEDKLVEVSLPEE